MTIAGLPAATEVGRAELPDDPTRQVGAAVARAVASAMVPRDTLTWSYIAVDSAPGARRDPVLVQRRPFAQRLARFSFRWYWGDPVGSAPTRACCSRSATA